MYAVIRSGGKQVRVAPGQRVRLEKLDGDVGAQVELDQVLLVGGEGEARVGRPLVEGAKAVGTITQQGLGDGCSNCTVDPLWSCMNEPGMPSECWQCGDGFLDTEFGEECDDGHEADGIGMELDARAQRITTEFPVNGVTRAKKRLRGDINGGGPVLQVRASGGGVHIEQI